MKPSKLNLNLTERAEVYPKVGEMLVATVVEYCNIYGVSLETMKAVHGNVSAFWTPWYSPDGSLRERKSFLVLQTEKREDAIILFTDKGIVFWFLADTFEKRNVVIK